MEPLDGAAVRSHPKVAMLLLFLEVKKLFAAKDLIIIGLILKKI